MSRRVLLLLVILAFTIRSAGLQGLSAIRHCVNTDQKFRDLSALP